jgi:thiamine biosynthesis lipoprotein
MILVASRISQQAKGKSFISSLSHLSSLLVILILFGCSNKPDKIEITGSKMGTTYSITVVADQLPPDDLSQQIDRLLSKVDNSMSTYKDESEISRFNRLSVGETIEISSEFAEVIRISQSVWHQSNGAFDPTIGPLVDLWGFGPVDREQQIPSTESIEQVLTTIGFESIVLQGLTLSKLRPVALDLSAVAKGYAVDLVANYLEMLALPDYLVEIGGELRVSGANPEGIPWRIALEQPQLFAAVDKVIELTDIAIATSGDYRNYFEKGGLRYSHTIDPRNGMPIRHQLASVTVITESCAEADAWATAFSVLGADESAELANKLGLAAYMLVRKDDQFMALHSDAFDVYLD